MEKKNKVFIATSIDGYIADKNGKIDWLHSIPNPDNIDMGYGKFTASIDAIVMGRKTFETICGFDIPWPYEKHVFVLSHTMEAIPDQFKDNVSLLKGSLTVILEQIHAKGYHDLYIDGGTTIQHFLAADLIDEMTITIIPYMLGDGIPLFSKLSSELSFECIEAQNYLGKIAQNKFVRIRQ